MSGIKELTEEEKYAEFRKCERERFNEELTALQEKYKVVLVPGVQIIGSQITPLLSIQDE